MIKTYKIVNEDDLQTTYQYSTTCTWWVYGSIAVTALTVITDLVIFAVAGTLSLLIYMATAYLPAFKVARSISDSMRSGLVQVSGSRWSLDNPLTIIVPKLNTNIDGRQHDK